MAASERDVRIRFRQLSRIYHPDKHNPSQTGMSNEDAVEHFQILNNAQELLLEHLRSNSVPWKYWTMDENICYFCLIDCGREAL